MGYRKRWEVSLWWKNTFSIATGEREVRMSLRIKEGVPREVGMILGQLLSSLVLVVCLETGGKVTVGG